MNRTSESSSNSTALEIVGAGPAGLSAALAARALGAKVTVYEKRRDVGARFHGDFQGLENWTQKDDVLAELAHLGISTAFYHTPVYEIVCFDPDGTGYPLRANEPIFYLVRRGGEAGTLDHALKQQALDAGIELRFATRKQYLDGPGIVAEGPHRADVIAAGYVFETDMANGCYAAVSEYLAPGGYAYLLVDRGRGTVATCLFDDFHNERIYLERAVDFFRRHAELRWRIAHRFGGSGNYNFPQSALQGPRLYAGEAAGFQDALFGFGLRYALRSGVLAARAYVAGSEKDYDAKWRGRFGGLLAAGAANRWLYARLGDRGRRAILRRFVADRDPRRLLARIYAPAVWKTWLGGLLPARLLLPAVSIRADCDCTWCRCHQHAHPHQEVAG